MWKFLIGPALLGVTCLAGSIYGADAEQVVRKSPGVTYAAVEQAIDGAKQSGTMQLEGGQPVPYELHVERTFDQRLDLTLTMGGRQGAETHVAFTPQDNGQATLMTVKVHTDHAVLRQALAGTSKEKLGYAPDWLLNIAMKSVLKTLAEQIEQGETLGNPTGGFEQPPEQYGDDRIIRGRGDGDRVGGR